MRLCPAQAMEFYIEYQCPVFRFVFRLKTIPDPVFRRKAKAYSPLSSSPFPKLPQPSGWALHGRPRFSRVRWTEMMVSYDGIIVREQ